MCDDVATVKVKGYGCGFLWVLKCSEVHNLEQRYAHFQRATQFIFSISIRL